MPTITTQALVHGRAAAAGDHVRDGFAIDGELDVMFALGFPRFSYIADGHPDEEPADFETWQARLQGVHGHRGLSLKPRAVAHRCLRVAGCAEHFEGREFSAEYRAAVMNAEPLAVDEATACLQTYARAGQLVHFGPLYLFEALYGPDALLSAVVPILESGDPDTLHDRTLNYFAMGLTTALLRASPSAAADARARLRAILDASTETSRSQIGSLAHNVGLAVGGSAFAAAHARRTDGFVDEIHLEGCGDDPEFVRTQLEGASLGPPYASYPRLIFLAGESAWDRYRKVAARQKDGYSHREAVEMYGTIRSEGAARMLAWLATKSKAKRDALAWLKVHVEVFGGFLENIASGTDDDAANAAAVLGKLTKTRKKRGS